MNSTLFWNELSLVMKNELFTIKSFENDHGHGHGHGHGDEPPQTTSKAELHEEKIIMITPKY